MGWHLLTKATPTAPHTTKTLPCKEREPRAVLRVDLERRWAAKRTWLGDCFGLGIKGGGGGMTAFDYVYIRIRVKAGRKREPNIPAGRELERGF